MSTKQGGRPSGEMLFAENFEALLAERGLKKKDIASSAGCSAAFIADLLAGRAGAAPDTASAIAAAVGVPAMLLFPERAGWLSPLPDRKARRPLKKATA